MKRPAVSVIIPTFNRAEMVVEAVESVLSQTFGDYELIVVDDGSTDDTAQRLEAYRGRLRRVRQENRGVSAARNRGLALSGAPLVAFLDSDDLWHPEKLAVQASYLKTFPGAVLCHTDEIWIRRGRRVNPRRRHVKAAGSAFVPLLRDCLISPSSALCRREVIEEAGLFDESLPACEDYALWLRIARRHPIHHIARPLVTKRGGHADQLSRTVRALDRFRVRVLAELAGEASLSPREAAEVRLVLKEKCRILAAGSRKRGREDEAESYLHLAAERSP